MKLPRFALLCALAMTALPVRAEEAPSLPEAIACMKGSYETMESEILKVYKAENEGAQYRAYVVKWKDQEVVINDPLCSTEKKVGDKVTFMAQTIEMPHGDKKIHMIQFLIMDFGALLEK